MSRNCLPNTIPEQDLPPAWDGASRINILIIGLDYRDWVADQVRPAPIR